MPVTVMLPAIDSDEGIRLCGASPALYARALSLFPQDRSIALVLDALSRRDAQTAFLHAHTLKGLASQLALPALTAHSSAMCDCLRSGGEEALLAACALAPSLSAAYDQTLAAIQEATGAGPFSVSSE